MNNLETSQHTLFGIWIKQADRDGQKEKQTYWLNPDSESFNSETQDSSNTA